MKAVLAIARREIDAYFATPLGWLALCGFLAITGFFFAIMLTDFSMQSSQSMYNPYAADSMNINEYLLPAFFGNWAVILLFISPAISMRMFSEDMSKHSFEMLLSAPISSTQIVLGKYLGALGFLAVMFGATLHYVVILYWLGSPDPGVLSASYAATFLLAATFVAVGMLASAYTENQVVAFVATFALLLVLWVLSWTETLASNELGTVLSYASMLSHLDQLTKGLLHVKDVIYFVAFIGFFLFATQQRVESFRWR